MPKLLERSGACREGTITGIYSILVEGDDLDEPVSDAARGYLDGHIVLDRGLAERNHYPAVDVLGSVSRLAPKLMAPRVAEAAGKVKRMMAVYREKEDLIDVGAYARGSDPEVDEAIDKRADLETYLTQAITEKAVLKDTVAGLAGIAGVPLGEEGDEDDETISVFA
jgi:flagellum-specific ATP synthase